MPKPWNAEIRIASNAPTEAQEALEESLKEDPHPVLRLEHELDPTETERHIINLSREALSTLLKRIGVPPIDVPDERIHVLTAEEFREKVSEEAHAKTDFGHAYIPRSEDTVQFCHTLTHELCHAASRYGIQANQSADAHHQVVWERRTGIAFKPKPVEDGEVYWNGLNEGTTELIAVLLRRRVAKGETGFTEEQKDALTGFVGYQPWVILTDALIRLVAEAEAMPYKEVRDALFTDYFRGTYVFLKRLERHKKGATQTLRPLQGTPEDASHAAEQLSLDDVRDEMNGH